MRPTFVVFLLVGLASSACTTGAAPKALLDRKLPSRFVVDPEESGAALDTVRVLKPGTGAADIAVEHVHVAEPPTPGQLTIYALTFDHAIDSPAATAQLVTGLSPYVPTAGLSPAVVSGVAVLERQADHLLASTVIWVSGRTALVVTGGRLDDETKLVVILVRR